MKTSQAYCLQHQYEQLQQLVVGLSDKSLLNWHHSRK